MEPKKLPPFRRSRNGVFAGVAAGIARHLSLNVTAVRAVLIVAAGTGVGLLFYLWLWLAVPREDDLPPQDRLAAPLHIDTSMKQKKKSPFTRLAQITMALGSAMVAMLFCAMIFERIFAFPLLAYMPAVFVMIAGAILLWTQLADVRAVGVRAIALIACGGALIFIGGVLLVSTGSHRAGSRFFIYLALFFLFLIIAAPIVLKLSRDLSHAKVMAALQAERADVAAHLHDSVLQALTMIRARSEDSAFVERVARAQERDLRAWLYGTGSPQSHEQSTQEAIRAAIADIEDTFDADVSLVVVGEEQHAGNEKELVAMLREATSNAIRHGKPPYSVYVELERNRVVAFVRDHGDGFSVDSIPSDRHGVRESIIGRAKNLGGSAEVKTKNGTEIQITIPSGGYTNKSA